MKSKHHKSKHLSSNLGKVATRLPDLLLRIEQNHRTAQNFIRRLNFLVVYSIGGAGPGLYEAPGGGETPDENVQIDLENILAQELDRAIDTLQELIDAQQEAMNGLGGSTSSGGQDVEDKPCQAFLEQYQAALKIRDKPAAVQAWDQYSACISRQASASQAPSRPRRANG